ncbi:MAG: HlyD family efflux transporter periplasmic adaptor subunit [Planctomycetota bacterium]
MKRLWVWIVVLGVVAGAGTLVLRPELCARVLGRPGGAAAKDRDDQDEHDKKTREAVGKQEDEEGKPEGGAPSRVARLPGGEVVVTLDAPTQQRVGLRVEALDSATRQPEVVAYGILEDDPAESFTLRAPLAGVVRRAEAQEWPALGVTLAADVTIGLIEPRLSPAEQLDMTARLATARGDLGSATASLEAARASCESKRELHDRDKVVSDRVMEEAQAQVKQEEARLQAATETVRLLESCLETHTGPAANWPLTVPRSGVVVEVPVQPGEAVESGQALLRVARFDRLIARVEIPAGERIRGQVLSARVVVIGQDDWIMVGEPIGLAPTVDVKTQGQAYQLRVAVNGLPVRPGLAVTAHLALPGEPLAGVVVPRSAIIRYASSTWVYVQAVESQFARREVKLSSLSEAGWFVTSGSSAGDRVVVTGAQMLLSEELKAQIEREAEAEE